MTGKDSDTVTIDDADVTGLFMVKTHRGQDTVLIETVSTASAVPSHLAGQAKIDTGGDDDAIVLGLPSEAANAVEFGAGVLINGGRGTDSLTYLSSLNIFAVDPIIKGQENIA